MRNVAIAIATVISAFGTAAPAATPLSVRDSFRIGTSGTIFCSAQTITTDAALKDMFDAGYAVTCRDAALPVGKIYKLRASADAGARLAAARAAEVNCTAPTTAQCAGPRAGRDASIASSRTPTSAIASTNIAKATRSTPPKASPDMIARSSSACAAWSPTSRSRASSRSRRRAPAIPPPSRASRRARSIPSTALAEAYRRNNAGSYAEAAEFFAAVSELGDAPLSRSEALANEALQKSNLGRYAEADALFARAAEQLGSDPLVARRLRNYRAMHLLNQGDAKGALAELDKPLPTSADRHGGAAGTASRSTPSPPSGSTPIPSSASSWAPNPMSCSRPRRPRSSTDRRFSCAAPRLRLERRSRGVPPMRCAVPTRSVGAVRSGKVASIVWMRAQIARRPRGDRRRTEATAPKPTASTAKASQCSRRIIQARPHCSTRKARLAGYLARSGQARAGRSHVPRHRPFAGRHQQSAAVASRTVLQPYVDVLLKKANDPAAAAEIFTATQLMVRPGPRPDPGRACARAERRHRRSVAPVPPVGHADPPARAQSRSSLPGSKIWPSRRPTDLGRARVLRASLAADAKRTGRDPGGAGQLPPLSRRVERR